MDDPLQSLLLLMLILLLILLSALFAAAETAFSALNRVRVKNKAENGASSKRAALALRLYENYDELISTIIVGNNVMGLSAASAAAFWSTRHFGGIGASVSAVVITVAVIFLSEITPKSLAKENPESYALFIAPFLRVCMFVFKPLNFVFIKWKKVLGRIYQASPDDQVITEEELLTIVDEAEQDGAIDEDDKELIHNVIEFSDLRVDEILTPRVHIVGMAKDSTTKAITEIFITSGYSRIPVYDETIDNIVGIVHLRDFFEHMIKKEKPLSDIITQAVFVAPSVSINDLLKQLQKTKSHMAVVADEYGGTMGIVTMEDILEQLVGDIYDEHDEIIEEFILLEENLYKMICTADVEHMFKFFKLELPEDLEASTISGWIMDVLEKIPEEGDTLTYQNLTLTVHKAEGRIVLECLVKVEQEQMAAVAE